MRAQKNQVFGREDASGLVPRANPDLDEEAGADGEERYLSWWDLMADLDPEWLSWSERVDGESETIRRRVA